jgi:hypothetical protein
MTLRRSWLLQGLCITVLLVGLTACESVDQKAGKYESGSRPTAVDSMGDNQEQSEMESNPPHGTRSEDSPTSKKAEVEQESRYSHPSETGPGGTNEERRD